MKKVFSIIGIFTLMIVSFIYTDKTVSMASNFDNVMATIKENSSNYMIDSIDGTIIDDIYFIPGISGKIVDEKKSYNNMKKIGEFNKNLIEYKSIEPKNRLKNNIDKYIISGNKNKNEVSIILLVNENCNMELNNKNINYFIDGYWLEKNSDKIEQLINNYVVGNLSYNMDYSNKEYYFIDSIIKNYSNNKYGYCYSEEEVKDYLNICSMNNDYSIKPSIIIKNNPLLNIKKYLENGSIISLVCNSETKKELPSIISYINSRGLKIVSLDELLNEEY